MDRTEHLKRFRGATIFLLVMQSIALAGGALMLGVGDPAEALNARATMIGAVLVLVPALMAWNGSLFGAGFLIVIMLAEIVIGARPNALLSWPTIRAGLYLVLSVWICIEVFRYRRKTRAEGAVLGGSAVVRWGGAGLVALSGGAIGFSIVSAYVSALPTNGMLTARQITGEQYHWMYENEILGDAERVFLFSADAGTPYSDGGKVLTNQFVGGWWREEDGALESGWIKLGEICRVEKTPTASDVKETLYTLHTYGDDSWLRILLPKEDGSDRQFLARMNYLNDQKMHHEVRSACDQNREPDWDKIALANGIERNIVGLEDIDPDHLTWLRHNDFLTHKENVLNFYSSGSYTIASGGLLLTDAYFGGWSEDTDGLQSWWFEHGEICTVNKKKNSTKTSGPLYKVESADNWFQFYIPDHGGQDEQFIDRIRTLNETARAPEQEAACQKMLKEKAAELAGN